MDPFQEYQRLMTRRQLFGRGKNVLGGAALASLLGDAFTSQALASTGSAQGPQFPPKAKRVIYLHMVGGRRKWICSTTNPKCRPTTTKICRRASATASA
ncbi:MAG: hypothetical protein R3F31_07795 [Verrucomicrobiales bacterium]